MTDIVRADEFAGDQREPWDRLDGEDPFDFEFAAVYFAMGRSRSMKRLAAETGETLTRIHMMGRTNSWVRRAEAYDVEQARLALRALEDPQVEMRSRHAEIARTLMDKAMEAAERVNPSFLLPKDVGLWVDVASKLERASRGLTDTKRVELTGAGGGPIEVVQALPTDDRTEWLLKAQKELNARLAKQAIEAAVEDNIQDADIVE